MDDYLTRVAEAVRDACAAEAFMETTLAVEYVSAACPGEIISNMILNNIDLQAVIASVPRPEPVSNNAISQLLCAVQYYGSCKWSQGMGLIADPTLADVRAAWDGVYESVQSLYAEAVAAQPAVPGGLLTAADMKHLRRFAECAEDWDTDEHDVSKEAMKRLERAGAVRSLGFGRHETTAFGDAMLAAAPEAPQAADDAATLRVDAERYRWLRDRCGIVEYAAAFGGINAILPSGDRLDVAIDSAKGGAA